MSGNKGLDAHNHGLGAWEMLHHEHWDLSLLEKLRDRLRDAVEHLTEHLAEVECPCGDKQRDIDYYRGLLENVEWGIRNRNLSPLPVIEEALREYMTRKHLRHRCIKRLLLTRHQWGMELMEQGCGE
ncbi:MAG: hypothetical protein LOD87_12955 [Planifilum fulgidum]